MEQVEADVALLMAGQVPYVFKNLMITTTIATYLRFQVEMPGLPSKELFE